MPAATFGAGPKRGGLVNRSYKPTAGDNAVQGSDNQSGPACGNGSPQGCYGSTNGQRACIKCFFCVFLPGGTVQTEWGAPGGEA